MTDRTPIIRLEGISKAFGPVQANRDITLDIQAGRILALLGENGAGKSTLMSILAGQIRPDSGRILLQGEPVVFTSTEQAIEAGIGMVYQHFKLVEAMSVAENVVLGQPGPFWLGQGAMHARVAALAGDYGIMVRPEARVAELSMGEKQQVEILKLLYRRSTVLIFDEPTAVLTPTEAAGLFAAKTGKPGLPIQLFQRTIHRLNFVDVIVFLNAFNALLPQLAVARLLPGGAFFRAEDLQVEFEFVR